MSAYRGHKCPKMIQPYRRVWWRFTKLAFAKWSARSLLWTVSVFVFVVLPLAVLLSGAGFTSMSMLDDDPILKDIQEMTSVCEQQTKMARDYVDHVNGYLDACDCDQYK